MESESVKSQIRIEPERNRQSWRGKRGGNNNSRGNHRDKNYTRRQKRDDYQDTNVARSSYNEELPAFCCGICNAKLRQIVCAKCLVPDSLEPSADKLKNLLNQNEELKHEVEQLRAVIDRDRERERKRRMCEADSTASALQDAISAKESEHKFEIKKLTHQIKKLHETVLQLEKENAELKSSSSCNNGR